MTPKSDRTSQSHDKGNKPNQQQGQGQQKPGQHGGQPQPGQQGDKASTGQHSQR